MPATSKRLNHPSGKKGSPAASRKLDATGMESIPAAGQKYRVQFDLSEEEFRLLEDLCDRASLKTKKELFSYATTMFAWAVEEAECDRMVGTYEEKERKLRIFQIPPLQAARSRAARKRAEASGTAGPTSTGGHFAAA